MRQAWSRRAVAALATAWVAWPTASVATLKSETTAVASSDPKPAETRVSVADWRAVHGGALLFGVAYGAAVVVGARRGFENDTGWLVLPAAGPWITLWGGTEVPGWALAADGVAQLAGASLFVLGFTNSRLVLGPASARGSASTSAKLRVVPGRMLLEGSF